MKKEVTVNTDWLIKLLKSKVVNCKEIRGYLIHEDKDNEPFILSIDDIEKHIDDLSEELYHDWYNQCFDKIKTHLIVYKSLLKLNICKGKNLKKLKENLKELKKEVGNNSIYNHLDSIIEDYNYSLKNIQVNDNGTLKPITIWEDKLVEYPLSNYIQTVIDMRME